MGASIYAPARFVTTSTTTTTTTTSTTAARAAARALQFSPRGERIGQKLTSMLSQVCGSLSAWPH